MISGKQSHHVNNIKLVHICKTGAYHRNMEQLSHVETQDYYLVDDMRR